jgi:type IV pilus assembly protein PilX
MRASLTFPSRQRGATLFIALIMLLLITLLAVNSMRGTTLEAKITGNLIEQKRATNAAEAALRVGERRLLAQTTLDTGSADCTTSTGKHANLCILNFDSFSTNDTATGKTNNANCMTNASGSGGWWTYATCSTSYLGLDGTSTFTPAPLWNAAYIAFDPKNSYGNVEVTDPDERSLGRGPHYYRVTAAAQADGQRFNSILQTVTVRRYY